MRDGAEGKRIPAARRAPGKLREVASRNAGPRRMGMLRCGARRARTAGMLGGPATTASGAILPGYYGKDIEYCDPVVRPRGRNGANGLLGRLAARGLGPAGKVFPGACRLKPGAGAAGLAGRPAGRPAGRMIGDIRRLGQGRRRPCPAAGLPRSSHEEPGRRRLRFLMLAAKREPIKRITREHAAAVEAGGDAEAVAGCAARGKDGGLAHRPAPYSPAGAARDPTPWRRTWSLRPAWTMAPRSGAWQCCPKSTGSAGR